MSELAPRIQQQMKPSAEVIACRFRIANWEPDEEVIDPLVCVWVCVCVACVCSRTLTRTTQGDMGITSAWRYRKPAILCPQPPGDDGAAAVPAPVPPAT